MVIFYDSSRTLNDQSVTLLRSTNEPLEKGVVLKVHPLGSSVPSSLSTTIPRPPSLSQWAEQSIGNVNPSKIRLKIKQPNEVVEPVKCRSDGKPSFGISKATGESLGGVCVDKVHSPKPGPSCIVSTPQDVEVTKGKDASDSEQNSGNSDSHWRRKRQRDNPSKNLDHEGTFCFLHDDLEAISGIQELFKNDNLGILPMQNDNYPSKRAREKGTPVATSLSTSEFSIQVRLRATSTITKFEPDDLISKADRQRAKMLGGDLIEKVVKTPFTLVTSFRDGVEKILEVIVQIKVVDATPLRERMSKYMDDVDRYSSFIMLLHKASHLKTKNESLSTLGIVSHLPSTRKPLRSIRKLQSRRT
nr:hypothetical protein CFP56_31051 [Quercus suber]